MNEKTELQKHEGAEVNRKRPRAEKKKGKSSSTDHGRRWLFLAVDLLLVALIVGVVVFITYTVGAASSERDDAEVRSVVYRLEIAGADVDLFDATTGVAVVHVADGTVIGSVDYHDGGQPYVEYVGTATEQDGKYFADKATYPEDLKTYIVTVRVDAEYESGVGYFVGEHRLAVGQKYQIRIGNYACEGECIALQPAVGG